MVWQETAALSIVGVTALVFAWRALRSRRFRAMATSPCACGHGTQGSRGVAVIYRARKGERPQIRVRYK
jgi:hypothetical protein